MTCSASIVAVFRDDLVRRIDDMRSNNTNYWTDYQRLHALLVERMKASEHPEQFHDSISNLAAMLGGFADMEKAFAAESPHATYGVLRSLVYDMHKREIARTARPASA